MPRRSILTERQRSALFAVLSQTLSLGKLTLFIDAIIQLVQQIAGKQIDWFCQIDACGSYVQPQFLSMLLKPVDFH